jgi:chromosome segregation ATPase
MTNRERSYSIYTSTSDKTYNNEALNNISIIAKSNNIFDLNDYSTINEESEENGENYYNKNIKNDNEFKFSNDIDFDKQNEVYNEVEKARIERINDEVKKSLENLLKDHEYNMKRKKKITYILACCDSVLKNIKEKISQTMEEYPNVDVSDSNISEELKKDIDELNDTYSRFYKCMEDIKPFLSKDELINIDSQDSIENKVIIILDVASKILKKINHEMIEKENEIKKLKEGTSIVDFEKIEKLKNDVKEAEEVNNKLKEEVKDQNFKIEYLQKSLEKLNLVKEKSEKILESVQEEISNLNQTKKLNEVEIQEKDKEISILNKTIKTQKEKITNINKKYEDLSVEFKKALYEKKFEIQENTKISEEIEEKEYEINYLRGMNEKQKALKEESDKKLELVKEEIKKINQEKRSVVWKVKELEKDNAFLSESCEKQKSSLNEKEKELEDALDKIEMYSSIIKSKEKEIAFLSNEKENLIIEVQNKVKIAKKNAEKMKSIENVADEEKKELNEIIKSLRNEISSLHQKYDEQQHLLEETKKEWEEAMEKLKISMEETENSLLIVKSNEQKINQLKNEKEKIINEYKTIIHCNEQKILELQNQKEQLVKERDDKTMDTEKYIKQIGFIEDSISNEKENLCNTIKILEHEINNLRETNSEQQIVLDKCQKNFDNKLIEVENTIKNKDETIHTLQNENKKLKEEISAKIQSTATDEIIEEMRENIKFLSNENTIKDDLICELKRQLKEAHEREKLANKMIQESEDEIQSFKDERFNYQKIIEDLNKNLEESKEQLNEAKNSERSIDEQWKNMQKETEEHIDILKNENNDQCLLIENLKNQLEISNRQKEEDQKSRDEADRIIMTKESQVEVLNDELLVMSNEIISIKNEFKKFMLDIGDSFPEMKNLYDQSNSYGKVYNLLFYTLEGMIKFNELNPHLVNAIHCLKTLAENTKPKCVLTSFNLCDYENSHGEIYGNEEGSKVMIQTSCKCVFHTSCLKAALVINGYNFNDNNHGLIDFKCPKCNKQASVNL